MPQELATALLNPPSVIMLMGAGIAAMCAAHLLVGQSASGRRDKSVDPLADLFKRDTLESTIRETSLLYPERRGNAHAYGAVLRERLDHLNEVQRIWGEATRQDAVNTISDLIRANLRSTDQIKAVHGDGFAVHFPNVDEDTARAIAERLRHAIAGSSIEGMGPGMRISASFGVAGGQEDEADQSLHERAEEAFETARISGEDHIITASEIKGVLALPSPDTDPAEAEEYFRRNAAPAPTPDAKDDPSQAA